MPARRHIQNRESCPFLPAAPEVLKPTDIKHLRLQGGSVAYLAALTCAQSLWLQALPAQTLLQLNHALAADIDPNDPAIQSWPLPYQAIIWIFKNRHPSEFIGNPVRHYQHLATRVSGPRLELRSWRAWACFHLAQQCLPADKFAPDTRQIQRECLTIPSWEQVLQGLRATNGPIEINTLTLLIKSSLNQNYYPQ